MIAAAAGPVPELFEHAGETVYTMDHGGQIGSPGFSVYANWHPDHQNGKPSVYLCTNSQHFSLGAHMTASGARDLAAYLVRAAGVVEATQMALDEERARGG